MIVGIVAVSYNEKNPNSQYSWAIGKNNGLLFKLPLDMKENFVKKTSGKFIVCGYNTLLSFPGQKALPNRVTICLAPEGIERTDCIIVHTLDDCLKLIRELEQIGNPEIYICGGAMVYKSFLPYYDKVILTKVYAEDKEATAFFPNLDQDKRFKIVETSSYNKDGDYHTQYITYERKK